MLHGIVLVDNSTEQLVLGANLTVSLQMSKMEMATDS